MKLAIDIETYSNIDLKKAGVYKYVEGDFDVILFGYKKDDEDVVVLDLTKAPLDPEIISWLLDESVIKHAYNANFEYQCLNKYLEKLGITNKMPVESWVDTMLLSAYAGIGGSLEQSAEAVGLEITKDPAGTRLINKFSKPCKPTKKNPKTRFFPEDDPVGWAKFIEYNRRDVEVESELYDLLDASVTLPEKEKRGWLLDLRVAEAGIRIDEKLVKSAIEIDHEEKSRITEELIKLTGVTNPNSNAQVSKWFGERLGTEAPSLARDKISELRDSLENDATGIKVLDLRSELTKTSLKKYHAIDERLCSDKRVHGVVQFYGSHTGRWAGRGVQVQNLPRNSLPAIDVARERLKIKDTEALYLFYGRPVSNIASELIRTCFIPEPGNVFVVVDYSAIEARVIAWLSGEKWRLDVFENKGGKIYEASASQIFDVPFEKICDKSAPEHKLRAQGKVAELALGYQGAVGALTRMDFNNAIPEGKHEEIVRKWREANPKITKLWRQCQESAINAIYRPGASYTTNRIRFIFDNSTPLKALSIMLPSGRCLYYPKAEIGNNAFTYLGKRQNARKLERIEMYGGRIVENCLSGETLVLTLRGWIKLKDLSSNDKVWDGTDWVDHGGLIYKGKKEVIDVDGVLMTPEHRIYTERGWKNASSSPGYNRYEVTLPNSDKLCRIRREKIAMEYPMRLRKNVSNARDGVLKGQTKVLRLYDKEDTKRSQQNPRSIEASDVLRLEINEIAMLATDSSSLAQLRWSGHQGLRPVVRELREFLGGHVRQLPPRSHFRQNRRERELLSGKLPVGNSKNTKSQQTNKQNNRHPARQNDLSRSLGEVGNRFNDSRIPTGSQRSDRFIVHKTGLFEQVYDLKDCGPNHCFTVLSNKGPMLVHNCTQGIARDILAESLLRLDAAGYKIRFHVHDEVIVEVEGSRAEEALKDVTRIMCTTPDWAAELPLSAEGFISEFYKKE